MAITAGQYAGIKLDPIQVNWAQQLINACRTNPSVTDRDIVCVLACVAQESRFYMYANDGTSTKLTASQQQAIRASLAVLHDKVGRDSASVGLFQQQPYIPGRSWGWGSIADCMDVAYSTASFLRGLLAIVNRPGKSVTSLVQTVQRSAYPDAYAKWEKLGWELLAASSGSAPAPAPVSDGFRAIGLGDVTELNTKGEQVRRDQADLNDTGFTCVIDGFAGAATVARIRDFQYSAGVARDGAMGPRTRDAIHKVPSWNNSQPSGGGYSAKRWQQELKNHGWRITVDGVWGPKSGSILRQFQADKHIDENGARNYQTWSALFTQPN